jgi:hypothetical protein
MGVTSHRIRCSWPIYKISFPSFGSLAYHSTFRHSALSKFVKQNLASKTVFKS